MGVGSIVSVFSFPFSFSLPKTGFLSVFRHFLGGFPSCLCQISAPRLLVIPPGPPQPISYPGWRMGQWGANVEALVSLYCCTISLYLDPKSVRDGLVGELIMN